ncbi:diaminohydroxyphosphoribosylaminopyrimidine deaminase/5-amino-6-(5-phosphoribosylamino)uracil reductase [Agrobacterium tumefaciens]|nr:diaminohydroxyphosphoribosylaminopyrimidine deaminase/5-amino-6-(5-phosphoribosylamino)uracil reductase [Agrobacterium radiobacter]MBB5587260.1 diaminohydroxyphosphoribosylaminopyrimidine deaminase/5-amino-6-(5-phosphoribosylamino)uracil reductase [Agrobacterium radiobacter]
MMSTLSSTALGLPPSALPGISPSRGEIRCRTRSFPDIVAQGIRRLPISPLEGEMPGRAEGGNPTAEEVDR